MNLIILINSIPLDNIELVLLSIVKKLDRLNTPLFQVSIQFFQVSNKDSAKEALKELDNELSNKIKYSIRDIINTITQISSRSPSEGGIGLTSNSILKVYLGSIVRCLD